MIQQFLSRNKHAYTNIDSSEAHGLKINTGKLNYYDKESSTWKEIKPPTEPYKIMTVKINLSSDPVIYYQDNATSMTPRSSEWDEFFGIYPYLASSEIDVKINPNNYKQYLDGTAIEEEKLAASNVMIYFPRMGLKITLDETLETPELTISITNNPYDNAFSYKAFNNAMPAYPKPGFSIGAYKGFVVDGKLRSMSGKEPTTFDKMDSFRNFAHANGTGYELTGFYQMTYIQAMYILKYKSLDSQAILGQGFTSVENTFATTTGATDEKGLTYGSQDKKEQMKLFGIEDLWGNTWDYLDGIISKEDRGLYTASSNFDAAHTFYTKAGEIGETDVDGYVSACHGNNDLGFLPKEQKGSATTYFCDYSCVYPNRIATYGGDFVDYSKVGVFRIYVNYKTDYAEASIGARLMRL